MPTLQQAWLCEQSVGDDQWSGLILQLNSCQQWHRRILQSTWAGTSSNTLILIMAFTALPATVSESLTCRLLPRHSSHQDNLSSLRGFTQSRWKVKKKIPALVQIRCQYLEVSGQLSDFLRFHPEVGLVWPYAVGIYTLPSFQDIFIWLEVITQMKLSHGVWWISPIPVKMVGGCSTPEIRQNFKSHISSLNLSLQNLHFLDAESLFK